MEQMNTQLEQHQSKQRHLDWRRERVAELSAQGRTEREIATILKVGLGTVCRDLSFVNKQARDNLKFHLQERLPAQLAKCQSGLDQVLKIAWNMIITDSIKPTKLQALSLISDCYRHQMDLSTSSPVIAEAMEFVNKKQEQIDSLIKQGEKIQSQQLTENGINAANTTNGVF
jgi:hypothetical protein